MPGRSAVECTREHPQLACNSLEFSRFKRGFYRLFADAMVLFSVFDKVRIRLDVEGDACYRMMDQDIAPPVGFARLFYDVRRLLFVIVKFDFEIDKDFS